MTEVKPETMAEAFGYTQQQFDDLIETTTDIYDDLVYRENVQKMDIFERFKEVANSAEDMFVMTWCFKNLEADDVSEDIKDYIQKIKDDLEDDDVSEVVSEMIIEFVQDMQDGRT